MEEESGTQTRALLAIVLALVVIMGYQFFFAPKPQTPKKIVTAKKTVEKTARTEKTIGETIPDVSSTERPEHNKGMLITVDTPLYSAVISSRGGTIKAWKLKDYKDDNGSDIVLTKKDPRIPPLAMGFGRNIDFKEIDFDVVSGKKNISLGKNRREGTLLLTFRKGSISITRTFKFYADDYRVDIIDNVSGLKDYWITLGSGFGVAGTKGYRSHSGPVILKDADRIEIKPAKLKEPKSYTEGLRWVAQEDKYFFSALVPIETPATGRVWRDGSGEVLVGLNVPGGKRRFLLYAGPKDHNRLKGYGVGLEYIIDFGFFSILARPLFWILKFFYKIIGNYGWAIILLTIVVRIPFIPIVNKGQKSMKKLQALQPKMNEVRQKYKKDPQKMQKEMMELYKKYKVNPMSGCLPMLIQIPVFFALYKVLLIAIELRGAPFIFWIHDLSEKDPYYILPIVMGITMFVQQKMTPATGGNPQQQKFMQFMPIIFTFLFLSFPSGLVLYWLVSNLLSIAQQFYVNRRLAKEAAEAASA